MIKKIENMLRAYSSIDFINLDFNAKDLYGTADIICKDKTLGTMQIRAVRPAQGTGNDSTYSEKQIDFGNYPKQPNLIPVSKKGILVEACLPLFLVKDFERNNIIYFGSDLEALTLDENLEGKLRLQSMGKIGNPESMRGYCNKPEIYITTGHRRSNARFGDPSCLYNPRGFIQVIGTITVTESCKDLAEILDNGILPKHSQFLPDQPQKDLIPQPLP